MLGRRGSQGQTIAFGVISGLNRRLTAMNGGVVTRAIQARHHPAGWSERACRVLVMAAPPP